MQQIAETKTSAPSSTDKQKKIVQTAVLGTAEETKKPPLSLTHTIIADCLQAVEQLIIESLHSNVELINIISNYIINSGGKRFRPITLLLIANAADYKGSDHIPMAAALEFIHNATLLHDDVVDASSLRRGKKTAHILHGNEAAVLVGDYLYTKAFKFSTDVGNLNILKVLSDASNVIAEGEVLQLIDCRNTNITEQKYLNIIQSKTAKLFEAAAEIGAILANVDATKQKQLAHFGLHLGTAFQLIDDCLDYQGLSSKMGKARGNDLLEGKVTLPLIYAMQTGAPNDVKFIKTAIAQSSQEDFNRILTILEKTNALMYTKQLAKKEIHLAQQCLQILPSTQYKEALFELSTYAVGRSS